MWQAIIGWQHAKEVPADLDETLWCLEYFLCKAKHMGNAAMEMKLVGSCEVAMLACNSKNGQPGAYKSESSPIIRCTSRQLGISPHVVFYLSCIIVQCFFCLLFAISCAGHLRNVGHGPRCLARHQRGIGLEPLGTLSGCRRAIQADMNSSFSNQTTAASAPQSIVMGHGSGRCRGTAAGRTSNG